MVGKAKSLSNDNESEVYQRESNNENYSATQQNAYNLGSTHFSDQSGIGNFNQSAHDPTKANLSGALFNGNLGHTLQLVELDVGTDTINLLEDNAGDPVSSVSGDVFVSLSAGTTADLVTITGAQRPGQRLRLYNTLTNTITIKHTAAATVNTIRTPTGLDVVFPGNASVDLTFDLSTAQWRVVGNLGGTSSTGYSTIQDEGIALAQRPTMNFIGAGVTAVDNVGQNRTDITIPGGGGSQTPWLSDIDAAGFDLNNIGTLSFDIVGSDIIVDPIGMLFTVPAADQFDWTIAASSRFTVADTLISAKVDLSMGTSNIIGGGAGEGMTNVGHFDFVDNLASPIAAISIFNDGSALQANTLGGSGNIFITPAAEDLSMVNQDIISSAGNGMTSIGHLDFLDNLATPVAAISLYSDGTDLFANTGGTVVNLTNAGLGVFLDSTFRIQDNGDQTKQLAFEVSGISAFTTKTFSWPDADGEVLVTPSQIDWDLNTFDIFNIDSLTFQPSAGSLSSVNVGFSALGSGGFRGNILNNGQFQWTEENTLLMKLSEATSVTSLDLTGILASEINLTETTGSETGKILQGSTTLQYTTSGTTQEFLVGVESIAQIDSDGLAMQGTNFILTPQIGFSILGNIIEDDSAGMRYLTVPGDQHLFGDGTNIFATLDIDGLFLNQLFIQFTSIASPGPTGSTNVGELFMDSGNNDHLSIIRNGAPIDLEDSGGTSDTITAGDSKVQVIDTGTGSIAFFVDNLVTAKANIFSSGFNFTSLDLNIFANEINSAGNLSFTLGGTAVLTTEAGLYSDGTNLISQVPTGDGFTWKIGANQEFGIGVSTINFSNNKGINAVDPTADQDVATKVYVDSVAGGDGVQDVELNTTHETSEFDHQLWTSHAKQGDKDQDQSSPIFGSVPQEGIYFYPFYIGKAVTISRIGVEVGILDVDQMSVAIYDNTPGQNYPRNRLASVDNQTMNTTGIYSIFIDEDVTPGLYWIATWFDGGNTSTIRGFPLQSCNCVGWATTNDNDGALTPVTAYVESGFTSSTMPATAPDEMVVYDLNVLPAAFALLL